MLELGQEMNDDASLVVLDSQVLLLVVLCVCGLIAGVRGVWAAAGPTRLPET